VTTCLRLGTHTHSHTRHKGDLRNLTSATPSTLHAEAAALDSSKLGSGVCCGMANAREFAVRPHPLTPLTSLTVKSWLNGEAGSH
jgi:hypothetical protein